MTPKKVSLSGKTRLTYSEAVALLRAAYRGEAEMDATGEPDDLHALGPLAGALDKLKTAIGVAGGYDEQGRLIDPFDK